MPGRLFMSRARRNSSHRGVARLPAGFRVQFKGPVITPYPNGLGPCDFRGLLAGARSALPAQAEKGREQPPVKSQGEGDLPAQQQPPPFLDRPCPGEDTPFSVKDQSGPHFPSGSGEEDPIMCDGGYFLGFHLYVLWWSLIFVLLGATLEEGMLPGGQ